MLPTSPDQLPEWLREAQQRLNTHALGRALLYAPQMDSTNTLAATWVRRGAPAGACVVTDHQRAGRGRAGRAWEAEPAANLTLSVVVKPRLPAADWPLLGLAAAVAVARTVEMHLPGPSALVKWPNDILLHGKKVAGLLLESSRNDAAQAVIVGIGLNVNQTTFPDHLSGRATSLQRQSTTPHSRAAVFATLLDTLEQLLGLCTGSGLPLLFQLYTARLAGLGETVTFYETAGGQPVQGRLTGLTSSGALCVETDAGTRIFHAGDLTTHPA